MLRITLQQKRHDVQASRYAIQMSGFQAQKFGDWLAAAYRQSRFKSYAEVAERIGVSRNYISALVNARKQHVTNKPIRPGEDKVIALAQLFDLDVNEALLLAGYAPISTPESIEIDDEVVVSFLNAQNWDDERRRRVIEQFKTVLAGINARDLEKKKEGRD